LVFSGIDWPSRSPCSIKGAINAHFTGLVEV
jgi:hypothetical protein